MPESDIPPTDGKGQTWVIGFCAYLCNKTPVYDKKTTLSPSNDW